MEASYWLPATELLSPTVDSIKEVVVVAIVSQRVMGANHHLMQQIRSKATWRWTPLYLLRCLLILIGLWFVASGWINSIDKYLSKKTSVSFIINETNSFRYPSITFCPGCKSDAFYVHYKSIWNKIGVNPTSEDLKSIIGNISYSKKEFLAQFEHFSLNISDSNWLASNPNMGYFNCKCFTYNPQMESEPELKNGILFNINYPLDLNPLLQTQWFLSSTIILHDPDKFFYYMGKEMPSSTTIDLDKLKFGNINFNTISIDYSRFTSLSTNNHPCSSDENYSFKECYDKNMAIKRGCQKPWSYSPKFGIRKCDTLLEITMLEKEEFEEATLSPSQRANISGCPPPCTNSIYKLEYSTTDYSWGYDGVTVMLYFKDFRFQYSEEYVICDLTCLIGEIGGNFGFFLGGSILGFFDVFYNWLRGHFFK